MNRAPMDGRLSKARSILHLKWIMSCSLKYSLWEWSRKLSECEEKARRQTDIQRVSGLVQQKWRRKFLSLLIARRTWIADKLSYLAP